MIKKFIKRMIITFAIILGVGVSSYFLFTKFNSSFGGDVSHERQDVYESSSQFRDGKFRNEKDVPKELSFGETLNLVYNFLTTKVVDGRPNGDLTVEKIDSTAVANYNDAARLIWFGHSSFLLQLEGKTILIDPMLGKVSAPHPWLGGNRFNKSLPIEIEKIPHIDAIIYSHDHYDHLDYESVMKLKDKTNHFYVPLGVGVHLEAWGIAKEEITELDWWQETQLEGITLACTPSQHFSGRKFSNGQSTLWCSWVIKSPTENIYFSGDGGYAKHFKEIGDKYGPFDLAMMECGQYNPMWADIHMMPEQTAQAGLDVKAKKVMPIHWAGFKLALHGWKDPIERLQKKAKELDVNLITPMIGEEIIVSDSFKTYSDWWKNL